MHTLIKNDASGPVNGELPTPVGGLRWRRSIWEEIKEMVCKSHRDEVRYLFRYSPFRIVANQEYYFQRNAFEV